jgi:hypothetical protein
MVGVCAAASPPPPPPPPRATPLPTPTAGGAPQESLQAGSTAAQQGRADDARAHAAVVSAALGTLSGFVEWAPLARLVHSGVVEAAGYFMGVPDFRATALGVLKQVRARRGCVRVRVRVCQPARLPACLPACVCV